MSRNIPTHTARPYPAFRNDVKDFLDLSRDRNHAYGMSEADVTGAYEIIRKRRETDDQYYSFSAYLLWCYARTIAMHPNVQAMRHGNKLVTFEDVDVAMSVEKTLEDGTKYPFPYIFRSAQQKTFEELCRELEEAKNMSFKEIRSRKKSRILRKFPKWIRMWVLRRVMKNAFKTKEVMGTTILTCLGTVMSDRRFWPVATGPYPLIMATGSIYEQETPLGIRKFMCFTVSIDHDISDGAPLTRFGEDLIRMIEDGEGL